MAGLCPGHPRLSFLVPKDVDTRHKAGHDEKKLDAACCRHRFFFFSFFPKIAFQLSL
jgi:hypothetical protein